MTTTFCAGAPPPCSIGGPSPARPTREAVPQAGRPRPSDAVARVFVHLAGAIADQLDTDATIDLAGVNRHWRNFLRADDDRLGRALLRRRLAHGELRLPLPELPAPPSWLSMQYAAFVGHERALAFFCNRLRTSTTFDLVPTLECTPNAAPMPNPLGTDEASRVRTQTAPPAHELRLGAACAPYAADIAYMGVSPLGRYVWQVGSKDAGHHLGIVPAATWTPTRAPHALQVDGSPISVAWSFKPRFFGADRYCIARTRDHGVRLWTLEASPGAELATGRSVELDLPRPEHRVPSVRHADLAPDGGSLVVELDEAHSRQSEDTLFLLAPAAEDAGVWRVRRRLSGLTTALFGTDGDQLVAISKPSQQRLPAGSTCAFDPSVLACDLLLHYQIGANAFGLLRPDLFAPIWPNRPLVLRAHAADRRYAFFQRGEVANVLVDLRLLTARKLSGQEITGARFARSAHRLVLQNEAYDAVALENLQAPAPRAIAFASEDFDYELGYPQIVALSRSGRVVAQLRGARNKQQQLHVSVLAYGHPPRPY